MLAQFLIVAHRQVAVVCDYVSVRAQRILPAIDASVPSDEPPPLSCEESWSRATGTVAMAVSGFERVRHCHAEAAHKLDAADYLLRHILRDVRIAMPIPADGSELRAILAEAGEPAAADQALAA